MAFRQVACDSFGVAKPGDTRDAAGRARRHGRIGKLMLEKIAKGSGVAHDQTPAGPRLVFGHNAGIQQWREGGEKFSAARGAGERASFQQGASRTGDVGFHAGIVWRLTPTRCFCRRTIEPLRGCRK